MTSSPTMASFSISDFSGCLPSVPSLRPCPRLPCPSRLLAGAGAGLGEAAGCVQGLEEASGDYSWGRCRPGGAWAADREGQLGWGPWRVSAGDRGRCWGYEDGAAVRGSQVPIPWDMGTGWEAGDLLNQNIWALPDACGGRGCGREVVVKRKLYLKTTRCKSENCLHSALAK